MAACGDDPTSTADTTPPTIRDIRAQLGEPFFRTIDLNRATARRVILEEAQVTFRIFAEDDETPSDAIVGEVIDRRTSMPPAQTVAFRNGLIDIVTTVRPGLNLSVRLTDAANNVLDWPNSLDLPTRPEAVEGEWGALSFSAVGELTSRRASTWRTGTWCTEGPNGTGTGGTGTGGTYVVEGEQITVQTRHALPCDADQSAEWDTVERTVIGPYYVDETYFAPGAYTKNGGAGLVGTWERAVTVDGVAGQERLMLNMDDSWTWTRDDNTSVVQEAGTYAIVERGGYEDNFGDLLVRTVTERDNVAITPEMRFELYVVRGENLLIEPFVDTP